MLRELCCYSLLPIRSIISQIIPQCGYLINNDLESQGGELYLMVINNEIEIYWSQSNLILYLKNISF